MVPGAEDVPDGSAELHEVCAVAGQALETDCEAAMLTIPGDADQGLGEASPHALRQHAGEVKTHKRHVFKILDVDGVDVGEEAGQGRVVELQVQQPFVVGVGGELEGRVLWQQTLRGDGCVHGWSLQSEGSIEALVIDNIQTNFVMF